MDIIIDVFVSARLSQCGTAHHMTISVVHELVNKTIFFLYKSLKSQTDFLNSTLI